MSSQALLAQGSINWESAEVLHASETKLQRIAYVGEVRSRRMRNAAIAAVYEYLSG